MAIEKIIVIKADTKQAVGSIDVLTDSIQEQEKELLKLQEIYKDAPAARNQALKKRIDKLTTSIDKQKDTVSKLNKEQISANKTNETTLTRVRDNGGAISVLDSLTGGLATRVRDAAEATNLFNTSLKGTRTALIATGIGIFLIALAAVVVFWDQISEAISGVNKKLQEQIDLSIQLQNSTKLLIDLKTSEIALAEKEGRATDELIRQKIDLIRLQSTLNDQELDNLEIKAATLKASALELTTREKILRSALNLFNIGSGDAFILKNQLEDLKEFNELQDLIVQSRKEQVDLAIQLFDIENPDIEPEAQQRDIGLAIESELATSGVQITEDSNLAKMQSDEAYLEFKRGIEEQITLNEEEEAFKRQIFDENVAIAKIDIANNTLALLNAIAKEGSAVAKAVAIVDVVREQVRSVTGIISNTGIANAKAVAASPLTLGQPFVTFNTIAAGLGIAGSIAGAASAIKDITAEKKSVSGGGGANFGGGSQTSAPSFNLVAGSGTSQIAETLAQEPTPIRAFVVSSDQTTAAAVDRNIQSEAAFGG